MLKNRGYTDLTGVELSAKCVEHVSSCGITGIQGSISEAGHLLGGQKFDYVILSHMMEYVHDLKEALRQCHELMYDTFRLLATTDLSKCNIKAFVDNDALKIIMLK
jgi:2-polyprenyl-3-methyl-5-hydroxy-6-metoxy-1,4-benzoquinol methylase